MLDASKQVTEMIRAMNQSPKLPEIWARGMSDPKSLSTEERARFVTMNAEMFHVAEGMWRQKQLGSG